MIKGDESSKLSFGDITELLLIEIDLQDKFVHLNVSDLINENIKIGLTLKDIVESVNILGNIGGNLLIPVHLRVTNWDRIPRVKSGILFRWHFFKYGFEILQKLGYVPVSPWGLKFHDNNQKINKVKIAEVVIELKLLAVELELFNRKYQQYINSNPLNSEVFSDDNFLAATVFSKNTVVHPQSDDRVQIATNYGVTPATMTDDNRLETPTFIAESSLKELTEIRPTARHCPSARKHNQSKLRAKRAAGAQAVWEYGNYSSIKRHKSLNKNKSSRKLVMFSDSTELKSGKPRDGRHCDLCGSSNPVVRCEKCNNQIFCMSCDDMYHRHPRRKSHNRKAVKSLGTLTRKPPPVHVPLENVPEVDGEPIIRPVPPPRKKRFHSFLHKGPSLPKKELSWTERIHSLKRFMGGRPLPLTPMEQRGMLNDPRSDLPPLPARNPIPNTLHHHFSEDPSTLPVPVVEMGKAAAAQQHQRFLNRSISLRRPPGERSQLHQGNEGLPMSGSWDHIHQAQHDQNQEHLGGFMPHPHFGNPMMTGAMNQSVSVADLQTLMHQQHGEMGHHLGHVPHTGFGPAQSMSHLNCAQCMAMSSMWYNPHMMNACNTCHHHSMAAMSDTLRSHRHGSNSSHVETEGGISTGRQTPLSRRRAPSVARSNTSNKSRRSHRRTTSVDETQIRPVDRISTSARWTPQASRKHISSSETSDSSESEEEVLDASEESEESESSQEEDEEEIVDGSIDVKEDEKVLKKFDEEWQCEHCTYINPPELRICAVCCKTSENPYLLKPPKKAVSPPQSRKGSVSVKSKTLTRVSTLDRNKKSKAANTTNSLKNVKRNKEESIITPKSRQENIVISSERTESKVKSLNRTSIAKGEIKSHKSVCKDFEYTSFKKISDKSNWKSSSEKKSFDRTSESSVLSEPLYMNEQEVAEAKSSSKEDFSCDLPIENLYINENAKALRQGIENKRVDSEVSTTSASEDVRSEAKKYSHIMKRKKKLSSQLRNHKQKDSTEYSTEDEKKLHTKSRSSKDNKPPPRPTESKPGSNESKPAS
ncbi:hypothetical protein GQR58_008806 [Nymphon striatum]|nr:hypothetical protein GQR58_008806 [Nymphon striatum]